MRDLLFHVSATRFYWHGLPSKNGTLYCKRVYIVYSVMSRLGAIVCVLLVCQHIFLHVYVIMMIPDI